jgi:hypothetical protein
VKGSYKPAQAALCTRGLALASTCADALFRQRPCKFKAQFRQYVTSGYEDYDGPEAIDSTIEHASEMMGLIISDMLN